VKEAQAFVYKWCRDRELEKQELEKALKHGPITRTKSFFRRNFSVSSQIFNLPVILLNAEKEKKAHDDAAAETEELLPLEWKTAYDMRPWPDYPDQPSRDD
jgi:hypothetical protein